MCLLFTISLKFLQHNIFETSLTAKLIVSIKNVVLLKNMYVIIMPGLRRHYRMRQIAPFKK